MHLHKVEPKEPTVCIITVRINQEVLQTDKSVCNDTVHRTVPRTCAYSMPAPVRFNLKCATVGLA